jgi:DNA-binding transcriptional ArsR family regulator
VTEGDVPTPKAISLDALRALAHPLRVQLFSALTSYGPATASALAVRLGESSGATSYHLRQLERHGFVREDTSRGTGRDRWWERVPGVLELLSPAIADTEAGRAAGDLVETEFQRIENQRFAEYWRTHSSLASEWQQSAQITSANLLLSADELAALGAEFDAVLARYRGRAEDGPGRRRVDVHFRAFPVIDPVEPTESTEPAAPEGDQQ